MRRHLLPLICVAVETGKPPCGARSPLPAALDFVELMNAAQAAGWRVWRDSDYPDGDPTLAPGTALCPTHRGAP